MKRLALGLVMLAMAPGCADKPLGQVPVASASPGQPAAADDGKMAVLKGQPNPDARQQVLDLAAKLGLTGEAIEEPDAVGVKAGSDSVLVHKSTGIAEYNTPYKWGGLGTGNAPDLEACKGAATQFLAKLAIAPQDQLAFSQAGESGVSTPTGENRTPERQLTYSRLWAGKPIYGPGSQLMVFVGEGGRIDGAFIDWPTLAEVKRVAVKGADEARAQLAATIDHVNAVQHVKGTAREFQVKEATLGYVARMGADGTRDLYPAYAYAGNFPGDGTRTYFVAANDDYPMPEPARISAVR